jgi:ubiquinone/menaquinone biosynthesis C-methylase UbiE
MLLGIHKRSNPFIPERESGMNQEERFRFWEVRSREYKQLQWVNQPGYLKSFLITGEFSLDDVVLDVGSGTGIIAHSVAPIVSSVTGLDISADMLNQAEIEKQENENFVLGDVRDALFESESFSKVTARMVFHHIMNDIDLAMANCFRVLRSKGRFILSEGIPPHPELKDWYTGMFKLKEERRTFLEQDLVELAWNAGFTNVQSQIYVAPGMSIKNWLSKSGLPQEKQDTIFQMHLDLDQTARKHYNMSIRDHDVILDWKFVILSADKS